MVPRLSFLLILVIPFFTATGKSQTTAPDCTEAEYKRLVEEADSLSVHRQFETAIKKFRVAKICKPSEGAFIDAKIDKIYEEIIAQRDRVTAGALANKGLEMNTTDALAALRLVATAYRMAPGAQTQKAVQEVLRRCQGYNNYFYSYASEPTVNWIQSLSYAHDGKQILIGTNGDGIYLLSPEGQKLSQFYPKETCLSAAFTPDSRNYFASFLNKTCLYQLEGEKLRCYPGHDKLVNSVAVSPDGRYLASGGDDHLAVLWTPDTIAPVIFKGHGGEILGLTFSPDGRFLLTGSADKTARLWDIKGKELKKFGQHTDKITSVAFSPDNQYVFTASADSHVKRWSIDGACLNTYYTYFKFVGGIYSMAVSPNGSQIAAAYLDGTATIWDTSGRQLQVLNPSLNYHRSSRGIAYAPDGQSIAMVGDDKTVFIWNQNIRLVDIVELAPSGIKEAAISADGNYVIVALRNSTAKLIDRLGNTIQAFGNNKNEISDVAISKDGQMILIALHGGLIKLFNAKGELLQLLEGWQTRKWLDTGMNFLDPKVYFTPDEKAFCTNIDLGNYVEMWGINGELLKSFGDKSHSVHCSAITPDGKLIATGSYDGMISIWDRSGNAINTFHAHKKRLTALAFSPNGQQIVSGGADNLVKVWKLDSTLIQSFEGHEYAVGLVGFTSDGQKVFSTCNEVAKIWDLRDGLLQTYQGQQGHILDMQPSLDGQSFLTAGGDGMLAKWKTVWAVLQDPLLTRLTSAQKIKYKVPEGTD